MVHAHDLKAAEARGYAQAEADIVASLRMPTKGSLDWHRGMLADAIEAGEHRTIKVPDNIDGMRTAG